MKKFLKFPDNFLWGASIAAHQTEGNNIHNDWWKYEEAGLLRDKNRSGIAVDFRNRYKEDLEIAQSLNFNVLELN
jgi:beta-glucosidase